MARSIRNFTKTLIIKDGKMLAVKLKDILKANGIS